MRCRYCGHVCDISGVCDSCYKPLNTGRIRMTKHKKVAVSVTRKSEVPESLSGRVFDRPSFLDDLPVRGAKQQAISKIAHALKALEPGKCLVYTVDEFNTSYASTFKNIGQCMQYMKTTLRRSGISHPRIVQDNDRVYIWYNTV